MSALLREFVANDALKKRLASDIRNATLAHAYLIEGRRGCGKHTVARAIAAAVNCEKRASDPAAVPCGTCAACKRVFSDTAEDVITVRREDKKVTLGVDAIRDLRRDVATVPAELDRKIYLIEDADTMTVQAQNALLLTLEEPPPFVLFLLLCENARSLLETIRSRAPTLRVEPLTRDAVDAVITERDPRARLTKNNAPEEYAQILTAADGSVGEALRLLDLKERKSLLEDRATVSAVVTAAANRQSAGEILTALAAFPQNRNEAASLFALLMTAVRDLLVLTAADDPHLCFYPDRDAAAEAAENPSPAVLAEILLAADRAIDALSRNASLPLTLVGFASAVGA